jgi:HEAT repeat protein
MRTAGFLGKLFNIRSDEWGRLSLLYAMSLIAVTGCTWGDVIVQSAFLQLVGVQYLPWVFISCAICSILGLFVYSAFADRASNTRLLIGLLAISCLGFLLGLALLTIGLVGAAYLLLFLVLQVALLDLYNVHWATYVNSFYDIRAAKRIIPILATAECLGSILGGLSMPLMNRILSPPAIIGAVLASLVVMAGLAAAMPRLLHEPRLDQSKQQVITKAVPADKGQMQLKVFVHDYGNILREGFQQIKRSQFLRWMALSTFSMTLLMVLFNYKASAIFLAELKTTVAISDYIGVLSGVANLIVLPVQLFLLSRLIARFGLGNASMIFPLTSLTAVGSLVIAPGLGTAALAYLDRTALRNAFRVPTDNLLFNAAPQRIRARTRAFVGGLLVPVGTILGGLLLLTPLARITWFLPGVMIAMGLAFVVATWMVRRHYGEALVNLLEQEDYASLALQSPALREPSGFTTDPASLARLAQKLDESKSPERTIFLAQLIAAVSGPAAVSIVGQVAQAAKEARLRAALVEVLAAAEVRTGEAEELYIDLLADPDAQVRLASIRGLEQIAGQGNRRYQEAAARLLADPETEVQLCVLPALLKTEDPALRSNATGKLRVLLKSPLAHVRAQALGVVGQAHNLGFLLELVGALTDSADEVRLAAGLATEVLASDELLAGNRNVLLALALLLLHDPLEPARLSAITVLDRMSRESGPGATAALASLAVGLGDPSSTVRERAVDALARVGRKAVPLVEEQLDAAAPYLRKMSALTLARIEPSKYAPLILDIYLNDTLLAIYQGVGCLHALAGCSGKSVAVLKRLLEERKEARLGELFDLLSAVRDPAAVETVARSLRSPLLDVRANATEALESLTTPKTAALVGSLFEPGLPSESLLSLASQTWEILVPTPAAALRLLLSDGNDAWQRTLSTAVLVEMSATNDPVVEPEIAGLLSLAQVDPEASVKEEASLALAGGVPGGVAIEGALFPPQTRTLSLVEKLILLQDVALFRGMSLDQLKMLASACAEERFTQGQFIFKQGDEGGAFYFLVSGRVDIQQEKRKGSFVRLTTLEERSSIGEVGLFDKSTRTFSAIAIHDTLTLRLEHEPLIGLARKYPEFSLGFINALSTQLHEAGNRIAELTQAHPRQLHKIYDELI